MKLERQDLQTYALVKRCFSMGRKLCASSHKGSAQTTSLCVQELSTEGKDKSATGICACEVSSSFLLKAG